MIFHRCDCCGKVLSTQEINTPFIRHDLQHGIAVSLLAVDARGKPADDVCLACKLGIATNGIPAVSLQLPHDATRPTPTPPPIVAVMAGPTTDQLAPVYEPSAPKEIVEVPTVEDHPFPEAPKERVDHVP